MGTKGESAKSEFAPSFQDVDVQGRVPVEVLVNAPRRVRIPPFLTVRIGLRPQVACLAFASASALSISLRLVLSARAGERERGVIEPTGVKSIQSLRRSRSCFRRSPSPKPMSCQGALTRVA